MGNVAAILAPDRQQMLDHLGLLFGRAMTGRVEITGVKVSQDGDHVAPRTRFFDVDQLEEAADYAAELNADHMWNVYVGAATRSQDVFPGKAARDEDFHRAWAIHADIDDGHDLEAVKAAYRSLNITPPFIVVTGRTPSTRAQLWWPLEESISDPDVYRRTLRGVAAVLHTDPSVTAAKQLMRLAGGVNWPKKPGRVLEKTEVIRPSQTAAAFPIEQIHRAFPPTTTGEGGSSIADVEIAHTGALGLEEKVMDGREGYAFRLVRAHLHEYMGTTGCEPTADDLYKSVAPVYLAKVDQVRPGRGADFLKQKCVEAIRAFESGQIPFMRNLDEAVQTYADRVRAGEARTSDVPLDDDDEFGPARPAVGDLFEVLTISDLRALPEATWIVKDAIPQGALGFVYGAPGSYKSFVCYDLALSLAYGHDRWLDRDIKHAGSVLYVASEGAMGAKNRITAWQAKHKIEADTDRFRLIRKSMSFMDVGDIDRLERTVAAIVEASGPVDTIFVDTVSRVLPGADENLQKDMTIFVAACDRLRERFEATVIGVHHTNKNGEMRGSTVFAGQGDFIFRVDKIDDERGGVLTCDKQKDAEDAWKVSFSVEKRVWIPAGHIAEVSSLTLNFGGEPELSDDGVQWPAREITRDIQRSIQQAWDRGKPWSPYPQTSREGRFAIRNISQDHGLKPAVAQMVLEAWLKNDVVSLETFDTHSKSKGLKVMKWID